MCSTVVIHIIQTREDTRNLVRETGNEELYKSNERINWAYSVIEGLKQFVIGTKTMSEKAES